MKLDTKKEIGAVFENSKEELEKLNINLIEDEFTVIQPFDDGNAIICEVVEEDDGRTVKQKITDTVIILPKKTGTLDVFK